MNGTACINVCPHELVHDIVCCVTCVSPYRQSVFKAERAGVELCSAVTA